MKYKLYEVGGRIRDFYLGVTSKDVDYTVIIEEPESYKSPEQAMSCFYNELLKQGYDIFQLYPETFTIRAMFPKSHKHSGVADFVIARREVSYLDNTRIPVVELGTLEEDLERRDFTINAMARDEDGNIIDPFGGRKDLLNNVLVTPKDAMSSFDDDPLRIIRAFRFHVTKDLGFSKDVLNAITLFKPERMSVVSDDRIREEFTKMFKHSTTDTLRIIEWLGIINSGLRDKLLGAFWLLPTNKKQF